jgi:hypothetical protein
MVFSLVFFIGNLLSQAQLADYFRIGFKIIRLQIIDQMAALADHLQQTAAAAVILLEGLEMPREVVDACRQKGDLDFGRPRVLGMPLILIDGAGFLFLGIHGGTGPPSIGSRRNFSIIRGRGQGLGGLWHGDCPVGRAGAGLSPCPQGVCWA